MVHSNPYNIIVRCVDLFNILVEEHLMINISNCSTQPFEVNTSLSFRCKSPESVLAGPNSSICMEDGNWEPDPRGVECKGTMSCVHTTG
jgi:hypothetical protein